MLFANASAWYFPVPASCTASFYYQYFGRSHKWMIETAWVSAGTESQFPKERFQQHILEWLAASVSVPVVRAIKHPAGLLFGATKVVSEVIGFLALQKQTSPSVCVWPRGMERQEERKSWTMCCFLLIENKTYCFPLRWKHSFTSKIVFMAFFSFCVSTSFFPGNTLCCLK